MKGSGNQRVGDVFCFLNGIGFLLSAVVTKYATATTQADFLFCRLVFFAASSTIFILSRETFTFLRCPKTLFFLSLVGFTTVNMNLTYLLSLNHVSTSDAYVLNRLRVIVTGVFSMLLCNEVFGTLEIGCSFVIIFGATLISKPELFIAGGDSYDLPTAGIAIILACMFFGGINSVCIRIAQQNGVVFTSAQFLFGFGFIGLLQFYVTNFDPENFDFISIDSGLVLSHVMFSSVTAVTFKISLDHISPGRFAVLSSIMIPISYLIDLTCRIGHFHASSLIGSFLVICGVLTYSAVQHYRRLGVIEGTFKIRYNANPHLTP